MMFGRKKKDAARDAAKESEETVEEQPVVDGGDESAEEATPQGPLDRGQVTDLGNRIDLGSVHVMPGPGMELRLEVDSSSQEVSALQLADDDGAVQVQVFAAPRSSGIWDEIRGEIAEMIRGNGGTVEETTGTFGEELRTRLAQRRGRRATLVPARGLLRCPRDRRRGAGPLRRLPPLDRRLPR